MQSVKIFMTTIGKGGGNAEKAREDFAHELGMDKYQMRWSGKKGAFISKDTKYIGFAYYSSNGDKMLAVYEIMLILPPGVGQRERWEGRYKTAETIVLGDLVGVMTWETYITHSLNNDGKRYDPKFPQGNSVRNINASLLDKLPEDLDENKLYTFSGVSFAKNKRVFEGRTTPEDRYEMVFKRTLDENFPGKFEHNGAIRTEDGKLYFPDFMMNEREDVVLIIEYDERNHSDRKLEHEISRMNDLRDHFSPKKMVFVRYGNAHQQMKDAQIFLDTIDGMINGTDLEKINEDKIVLIGYVGYTRAAKIPGWKVISKL